MTGSAPVAARRSVLVWRSGRPYDGGHRLPLVSLGALVVFVTAAVFAGLLSPHDPLTTDLVNRLKPPSSEFLLGTDSLGRDVFARLLYGARATGLVIVFALGLGAVAGTVLGLVAGFSSGPLAAVIARLTDSLLAFPPIFFGLIFAVTLGPGLRSVVFAIGLVLWARFSRIVTSEVLALRERDFIALARVNGCSLTRILRVHVLPNVLASVLVLVSINLGEVVLLEAVLSFLGAGIAPPTPSWGNMIADGQGYIVRAWWLSVVPGIAIFLTVLALNLFGDWVRDRLDPRNRAVRE
jgi:peptide/nickel transport system permease protein